MNINLKKVASIVIPILGAGISLASNWLDDKKLDEKVAEEVAKAFANKARES